MRNIMVAYYYGKEDGINGDFNLSRKQLRIIEEALEKHLNDERYYLEDRHSEFVRKHATESTQEILDLIEKIEHYIRAVSDLL